jgi:thiol-disulfide isomerase/thioredoxin
VVLLDFWASWCPDCIVEIPAMKKIYEEYGNRDDFIMIGVSLDLEKKKLQDMTGQKGMPWLQLFEEGKKWGNSAAVAYGIRSIPSVWVLDRQGISRGMNLHGEEEIRKALESAFGE